MFSSASTVLLTFWDCYKSGLYWLLLKKLSLAVFLFQNKTLANNSKMCRDWLNFAKGHALANHELTPTQICAYSSMRRLFCSSINITILQETKKMFKG